MMPCGNTAALLAWENRQDGLERQAPTEAELERFIDDWLERKARKMGSQFLTEAFCESDDYAGVYRAWIEGDILELGEAFDKIVRDYWRPFAIEESRGHNFAED